METLNIIDGQQRLTTLQYFLSALAMQLRQRKVPGLLSLIEASLWNSNLDTMEDPDTEVYKVWPTFRDRHSYQSAMRANEITDLISEFPDNFTQAGSLRRIGINHPPALEAIWFFYEQIELWLSSVTNDDEQKGAVEQLDRYPRLGRPSDPRFDTMGLGITFVFPWREGEASNVARAFAIQGGTLDFYCIGHVEYTDVGDSKIRRTNFCRRLERRPGRMDERDTMRLRLFNDSDYEYED